MVVAGRPSQGLDLRRLTRQRPRRAQPFCDGDLVQLAQQMRVQRSVEVARSQRIALHLEKRPRSRAAGLLAIGALMSYVVSPRQQARRASRLMMMVGKLPPNSGLPRLLERDGAFSYLFLTVPVLPRKIGQRQRQTPSIFFRERCSLKSFPALSFHAFYQALLDALHFK
jgi:hypothetical protein